MNFNNKLGFHWDSGILQLPRPALEPNKPTFILDRMMPEYVWDIAHLEDNPYTFAEVQALMEGIAVGGNSLFDRTQVLNQQDALKYLSSLVKDQTSRLEKELVTNIHAKVANEEALKWGCFREGNVGISGTTHIPPKAETLNQLFSTGLNAIAEISNSFEKALVYFFFGSMNQFFYDGNKRTSRMIMNYILMKDGYFYLSVPGARKDEFNTMMIDFYETKDATKGIKFLLSCYKSWD